MRPETARHIRSPRPVLVFKGPTTLRQCTDIVFLVIGAVFLIGMLFLLYMSAHYGCPYRLLYGVDSWGNSCNYDNNDNIPDVPFSGKDTSNLRYTYTYPAQLGKEGSPTEVTVCVKACPQHKISTLAELANFTLVTGSSLCLYDGSHCPSLPITPTAAVFHRCHPVKGIVAEADINPGLRGVFHKVAVDLEQSVRVIVYMGLLAVALSTVCLSILTTLGRYVIWLVVLAVPVMLYGFMIYCVYQFHVLKSDSTSATEGISSSLRRPYLWLFFAMVLLVVSLVISLIIVAIRKRVSLVSDLFKEAGKIVTGVRLLFLLPFLTLLVTAGSLSLLVYVYILMESSGQYVVDASTATVHMEDVTSIKYMKWYHLIGMFWIINFLTSCSDFIISSCVAIWYFTRNRARLKHPMYLSFWRLIRYHLGSVLLGSILTSTTSILKFLMEIIHSNSNGNNNPNTSTTSTTSSCAVTCFTKSLGYCLWSYDRFIKFFSNNTYTGIAMYGDNFFVCSQQVFHNIVCNVSHLVAVNSVGDFVLFLGKTAVMATCTATGYHLFQDFSQLHYPGLLFLAICVTTFLIAGCFFSVYKTAIDSLFVCFSQDLISNDGVNQPYFMNKGLMKYMKKSQTEMGRSPAASPAAAGHVTTPC